MAWRYLDALRGSRRFGKAARKQAAGRLREAYHEFLELDRWFDSRGPLYWPPFMITRLMTLVHLVEVAKALEEKSIVEASLLKWLSEYKSACTTDPFWTQDPNLQRWEKWARATLAESQGRA